MRDFLQYTICCALFLFLTACNFPQDPNGSFKKAKNNSLRIGVVTKADSSSVTEKNLIDGFAANEGLQTEYYNGTETELVKQLEEFKLDIVMGGFKKKSVWKKKVGMTKPYDSTHVFFIPKGENRLLYNLETFIHKNKKP